TTIHMKTTIIKSMTFINFKGIKQLTITPNVSITKIFGDNETGKTTIATGLVWMLWGKDLQGRDNYQIKTLDPNNNTDRNLEHSVSAVLSVDGQDVKIQRTYAEKWTTRRGEDTEKLTTHTTTLHIDDVPMSTLSEFTTRITDLICEETIFKMLTNPLFFNNNDLMSVRSGINENKIGWLNRQNILFSMVDIISDEQIISSNPAFRELFSRIGAKPLDDYKKMIKEQKKLLNDELKIIPARIDEINNNIGAQLDYSELKKQKADLEEKIEHITNLIMDKTQLALDGQKKQQEKIRQVGNLKAKLTQMEVDANAKDSLANNAATGKRDRLIKEVGDLESKLKEAREELMSYEAIIETIDFSELEMQIEAINKEELIFGENDFVCPTCKRTFEASDIDAKKTELIGNFNADRQRRVALINTKGQRLNKDKTNAKAKIEELKKNIEDYSLKIKEIEILIDAPLLERKTDVKSSSEYIKLEQEIDAIKIDDVEVPQPTELPEKRASLTKELEEINNTLALEARYDQDVNRIEELKQEQIQKAQAVSTIEKDEFTIDKFYKAKVETVTQPINNMFKTIEFKLFETQVNEGLKPCCEALINGVPFNAANSGAKIRAGLEVIEVLQEHFNTTLPVIIDNCEQVTRIGEKEYQMIQLFVSEADKELRII
ncbi:MAG: AAA family ATPase, partial [Candidatus Heimdallarchaeota archaeon]